MKKALFLLLAPMLALAQTDAPPERDSAAVPDQLPPVETRREIDGRLELVFQGNASSPERTLREALVLESETIGEYGLDEPGAFDTAFALETFYRRQGFPEVEVDPRIAGPWVLQLRIREGRRTTVGETSFPGASAHTVEELRNYLLGPTRERFPQIREDVALPFVEADIGVGVDLIQRLYASEGYLNAEVGPPNIRVSRDGLVASVSVPVREGISYRFGDVTFSGAGPLPESRLREVVAEQTEGIFTPGRVDAARRVIEDQYRLAGYFAATVTADANPESARRGAIPVDFLINPGEQHEFGEVHIRGTQDVRPIFIWNRLRRLPGTTYDPKRLDAAHRTLLQTGLFRNLRITPEAVEGGHVRLIVEVEEAKPKEFGIGIGYSTFFGGTLSASYRDLNFLRTGRPLAIRAEINQRGGTGEISFTDPWFLESDYSLKLRAYAVSARLLGYTKQEFGFRPEVSRSFTDHWRVSLFASGRTVQITDVQIRPEELVGRRNYSVISAGISQTLDYRNNPVLPTRGWIFETSAELAPGEWQPVGYVRGTARLSIYLPITERSSLALGARAGVIAPLGDGLPIDERFFNGGASTVRSFPELTLGPKDRIGYPVGGQAFTVFNVEYTFPIWGDLQGAVFADAGNVIPEAKDFGLENLRPAVGAGLRYNLPVGAVRFDYGFNPDRREGEPVGAFHFAIGVAF